MNGPGNEIFRLLQPGLMSEEEIRDLLLHRGVKMKDVRGMSKNEMVETYLHFFMPLPRRKSRNVTTERMIEGSARSNYLSSSLQIGFGCSTSSVSNSSILGKRGGDRLKPPLEQSHISSKKIILSQSSISSSNDSLDRIVIEDRSKERRDSKEEEKASSGGRQNVHENTAHKRCATSKTDDESDKSPPLKKVKQKIQWP